MQNTFEACGEDASQPIHVEKVALDQPRPLRDDRLAPCGEVVEDHVLVTGSEELGRRDATDVAGPARYEELQ